jgi:porin
MRANPVNWTFMAFDPNDRTDDYFPGDFFEDGVNIAVTGAHVMTLAGRKTTCAVTGLYSTAEGVDHSSVGSMVGYLCRVGRLQHRLRV